MRRVALVAFTLTGVLMALGWFALDSAGAEPPNAVPSRSIAQTPIAPSCAQTPGAVLPASSFDPEMVQADYLSAHAPVPMGVGGVPNPNVYGGAQFIWIVAVNYRLANLPSDFGARDSSPLVVQYPGRVFEAIETVQTFASDTDASRFLGLFGPNAVVAGPQATTTSGPQSIASSVIPVASVADEEIAQWRPSPSSGFPTDAQFVMRRGSTVLTLELIVGPEFGVSNLSDLVSQALSQAKSVCGL